MKIGAKVIDDRVDGVAEVYSIRLFKMPDKDAIYTEYMARYPDGKKIVFQGYEVNRHINEAGENTQLSLFDQEN